MFDKLLGQFQHKQEELQAALANMFVEAESGEGAVTVKASCDLQIENIKLDPTKMDLGDVEQVEDLVLVAVNQALDKAKNKAAAESNKLMRDMMPRF
jgi:DNA-binding YbaB/EbfC family protein